MNKVERKTSAPFCKMQKLEHHHGAQVVVYEKLQQNFDLYRPYLVRKTGRRDPHRCGNLNEKKNGFQKLNNNNNIICRSLNPNRVQYT
jgi:hypothetical protein